MTSKEVRNVIMAFYNSDIPGREETEIKTRQTAMRAVLDLDLVGKVIAVEKKTNGIKQLFLINTEIVRKSESDTLQALLESERTKDK